MLSSTRSRADAFNLYIIYTATGRDKKIKLVFVEKHTCVFSLLCATDLFTFNFINGSKNEIFNGFGSTLLLSVDTGKYTK